MESRVRKPAVVAPLPGLAPWAGGKRNAASQIVPRIDALDHRCYAEPFVGMGGVFFRRRVRPKVEVLNDRNGEVVNLFRIIKSHPEALLAELSLRLFSRAEFARLRAADPGHLTDVQRAARFYFIQRAAFGGRTVNPNFPTTPSQGKAIAPAVLRRQFEAAFVRLARVTIECLPYQDFIARYDRPGTLFYLDPPYWDRESIYGKGLFEKADFARLADLLRGIKGHFIMSINDVPEIRRLFAWAAIDEIEVTYKFNGTKRVTELLISGGRRRP